MGDGKLPMHWFDGVAGFETEVERLAEIENVKRGAQQFFKKANRGGPFA